MILNLDKSNLDFISSYIVLSELTKALISHVSIEQFGLPLERIFEIYKQEM